MERQQKEARGNHPPQELTRKQLSFIRELIARAKGEHKKEITAQDTIPYVRMWPDGTCKVPGNCYTRTIEFQDINYQLSQNEDKSAIFDSWCDFLNYFDSSVGFQFTYMKQEALAGVFSDRIKILKRDDDFNRIGGGYGNGLLLQMSIARLSNNYVAIYSWMCYY